MTEVQTDPTTVATMTEYAASILDRPPCRARAPAGSATVHRDDSTSTGRVGTEPRLAGEVSSTSRER